MKLTYLPLCLAFCSSVEGLRLVRKSTPAVVQAPVHRRSDKFNPVEHDRRRRGLLKRQNVVSATITNEITLYYTTINLGSPEQEFALRLDTGSSDMWVNVANSTLCQRFRRECEQGGIYIPGDSSTYNYVNPDFNISYADGSTASGPYVTDTLNFAGITLQNFQFGLAEQTTEPAGIVGIGYPVNEAVETRGEIYSNLPRALAEAGEINSNAYSLWLNDLDASEGVILFGGVNTARYQGQLQTFPIIATYGIYSAFYIGLTGIGVNGDAGSIVSDATIAALLDSGTSLTYLPNSIAEQLYAQYNTQFNERYGIAPVPCSLADESGSVEFTFSGLTISVGLDELVINMTTDENQEMCAFGIASAGAGGVAILGDTFLRSVYVVYDISNNEISMAATDFSSGTDDIQEIQAGPGGVPSATQVTNALSTASDLATGAVGNEGPTAFSFTASDSPTDTGNAAWPKQTMPPVWKYGGALAGGAAALAML